MKLSDAIMLGRTLVPARANSEWHSGGSGCARGMALEAIGKRQKHHGLGDSGTSNAHRFVIAWPWTAHVKQVLPCGCESTSAGVWMAANVIAHIFDIHVMNRNDWTIEQIADWVRSVEPEEKETENERGERETSEVECAVAS